MYTSQIDLDNVFYHMLLPETISEHFNLPPMKARLLGVSSIGGKAMTPDTFVSPQLLVLPMGWNWALHFCQGALEEFVDHAGLSQYDALKDRIAPSPLCEEEIQHASYVDNFAVCSYSPDLAVAATAAVSKAATALGLRMNPGDAEVREEQEFIGLTMENNIGQIRISRKRMWRFKFAIDELRRRGRCSGAALQKLIGHLTYACILRREMLSLLSACYAFVEAFKTSAGKLWDSVDRELRWFASLLPLCFADSSRQWSSHVHCNDAPPAGYGVCASRCDPNIIASIGRTFEKWRYDVEDSINARLHAMTNLATPELAVDPNNLEKLFSSDFINDDFLPGSVSAPAARKLVEPRASRFGNSRSGVVFDEVPPDLFSINIEKLLFWDCFIQSKTFYGWRAALWFLVTAMPYDPLQLSGVVCLC